MSLNAMNLNHLLMKPTIESVNINILDNNANYNNQYFHSPLHNSNQNPLFDWFNHPQSKGNI